MRGDIHEAPAVIADDNGDWTNHKDCLIQKFDRELAAINSGFPIGNIEQIISRPGAIGPSFLLNSRRMPHGIAARSRSPPHFWRRRHTWHSGKDLSSSRWNCWDQSGQSLRQTSGLSLLCLFLCIAIQISYYIYILSIYIYIILYYIILYHSIS